MSLIERINAYPLPFAQLLGVEFSSAEADSLAARMLSSRQGKPAA
jgi:hypothetical protein